MVRVVLLSFLSLAALCCVAPATAQAELIGIGISWRDGIFIQEYWHKGEPHYLLANLSKEDVEITVHEFDSKWRIGQPLPKAAVDAWKVPAGGQTTVAAKPLVGTTMWRFVIGGKHPIGVLPGPIDPGTKEAGYVTSMGLNGSGGIAPGIFVVQPKLELASDSTVKVTLHLPSKSGVLKFKREPDANADPLRPQMLIVESAATKTLPVTSDEKTVVINTDTPKTDAAAHEVKLTVKLPEVKSAQLFMFDGWMGRANGGGHGITRGLLVVP